jgi:hypothetical protein
MREAACRTEDVRRREDATCKRSSGTSHAHAHAHYHSWSSKTTSSSTTPTLRYAIQTRLLQRLLLRLQRLLLLLLRLG